MNIQLVWYLYAIYLFGILGIYGKRTTIVDLIDFFRTSNIQQVGRKGYFISCLFACWYIIMATYTVYALVQIIRLFI